MAYLTKAQSRMALRAALQTRAQLSLSNEVPINVFDVAENLGIEVRFASIGSFGGMWVKRPRTILISSLRPAGRQAYTCAHELGHWSFEHGARVDLSDIQELWQSDDEEELLANAYAGHLLMPPWAVKRAFERRSWRVSECSALQVFTIASQLGVSYEALVTHLCYSLKYISRQHSRHLLSSSPKSVRATLLPEIDTSRIVLVDLAWECTAVDTQVGDHIMIAEKVDYTGACVSRVAADDSKLVLEAASPGIGRLECRNKGWSAYIRVSRKEFEGRSIYRYLEDPDSDA